MKTCFTLIFTLFSVSIWATVHTVSNDPTRPAQFTTFTAAQTASSAGDTIYIYGSPFSYGSIEIRKRLVVIGAGYAPNNQFGQPTRTGTITLFRDGSNNPSGSVITGLKVEGAIQCSGTVATDNMTLFRNQVTSAVYTYLNSSSLGNNWSIYNNILALIYGGASSRTSNSSTNIIIANNIISFVSSFNSNTILVDHNIFLGAYNLSQLWNVIISNNIFVRSSSDLFSGEVVFCTFNKNISNQTTIGASGSYSPTNVFEATYLSGAGGSNSGSGNLVGSDPLFINVTNFNSYSTAANYRLQSGSPVKAPFGTDGTEAGIYGGSYPFPSGGAAGSGFDTSPVPPIPQVTAINIQNATIAPNGTLNVQVQGKVNN